MEKKTLNENIIIKETKVFAFSIVLIFLGILLFYNKLEVNAQTSINPFVSDNLSISGVEESALFATDTGYSRVFYDENKIYVEDYNNSFQIQKRRTIPMELSIYGGFYAGKDAYYFVFGQNNVAEDDDAEVVRVVKYSKSWNKLGTASLTGDSEFGHEIRYPFWSGNLNMAEYNGVLYIVTGHQGYVDKQYGMGHQGFLMFAINESAMIGGIVDADLWHSFSQYISIKDSDNIYVLEESEGNRQTQLTKKTNISMHETTIPILKYGGERDSAWAIPTYATADDIELSTNNILTVGTSIDQKQYDKYYDSYSETTPYNVYLTVTPMNDFTKEGTTFKWITTNGANNGYKGVHLTKISNNRFMLSWETNANEKSIATTETDALSSYVLHYKFLDGDGNIVSKEFTAPAAISECEPIVKKSKVVYYASDGGTIGFYSIDTNTGTFNKKIYKMAGKNAIWNFSNGVLTVSGKGALSDLLNWSRINTQVKKVVIKAGITKISTEAFTYLDNLESVVIEDGVTSIEDCAFREHGKFMKVSIPDSISHIGKDAFSTGWYSTVSLKPILNITIYCNKGSYAEKYAIANDIEYHINNSVKSIQLAKKVYTYTGKLLKPKVIITDDDGKNISKDNFKISYKNNKNIGTSTAIITFKNSYKYKGTVKKTFTIIPKGTSVSKITAQKAALSVNWKKQTTQTTGYEIQYSTNKKFEKAKKIIISNNKTVLKKITSLKKNTRYYIRIRTYKKITVNGKKKNIYSNWSKANNTKTKY